ncbi:MAG: thioredoxin domain-containing protein [Candidatus Lokiarchaeota archaeon]
MNEIQTESYNHLKNQESPYLLQHARNPVDWYPWSKEAFKKAKDEDKPVFLSIGYSTCHWCHVMAHESFEDPEVAKLMNEVFISIKVDREERPDIDKIYMTACQLLTGSGGWPLTIIMTPDKKPFIAGTYFPKETRFGRIGLVDLVKQIKKLWNEKREDLLHQSEKIIAAIDEVSDANPSEIINKDILKLTYNQLSMSFDQKRGGFRKSPKFPTPHNLLFLLRFWRRTGKENALKMVEKTLTEMRRGGIYDHIGYGFHRYSNDDQWLVPHFEKMLYDQALLIIAYAEAFQATGKTIYSQTVREIITYVLRDMKSKNGGFYSAEDADSEGEEGKFYVWKMAEVKEILNNADFQLFIKTYNISQDGNYLEESTKRKKGKNILHLKNSFSDLAKKYGLSLDKFKIRLKNIQKKLFEYREKRVHPQKDDKILTDWNGLMISALSIAGKILNEQGYLDIAKQIVNFIFSNLSNDENKLLHRFRNGFAEIDGYLDDYAFLIWGLLELYQSTFEMEYLIKALNLSNHLIEHFWDNNLGGFYFTPDYGENLIVRQKEIYDGAIPSGNSISMLNLLKLSFITGDSEFEKKADILSRIFAGNIRNNPIAYTQLMTAVDFAIGPSYSIVITGEYGSNDVNKFIEIMRMNYIPNIVIMLRDTTKEKPSLDNISNFVQFFDKMEDKATAYVCFNKMCRPPTTNGEVFLEYLKSNWNNLKNKGE